MKVIFFVLLVLGTVMLVLGAQGDANGFWEDRPFLTNVFSSLTAAMFGIPIALAVLHQVAATQASHAAEVRQRTAASNLLGSMAYQIGNGFPEQLDVGSLIVTLEAFGRSERREEHRARYQSDVKEFLGQWANAFSRPRYNHSVAALVKYGEQLSILRTLAMENGWEWADAIPADTSPPPDSHGLDAWRQRAFPAREPGKDWPPDEPKWEGLAEALQCARRVQDYNTDIHNAWYFLRER